MSALSGRVRRRIESGIKKTKTQLGGDLVAVFIGWGLPKEPGVLCGYFRGERIAGHLETRRARELLGKWGGGAGVYAVFPPTLA